MANIAEMTPFQAVTHYFDQACDQLGVRDEVRHPYRNSVVYGKSVDFGVRRFIKT